MRCLLASAEMLVEEVENFRPAVSGLLGTEGDPRGIDESVAGTVVAVEAIVLAELFQHRLKAIDMILVRIFVVVAEQAENGTLDVVGEIDRRDRTLGVERLGIIDHDVAA